MFDNQLVKIKRNDCGWLAAAHCFVLVKFAFSANPGDCFAAFVVVFNVTRQCQKLAAEDEA